MDQSKAFYQSKTVWASLITMAASVAGAAGYAISPDDQSAAVNVVFALVTGVSGAVALYGRVKAEHKISKAA